MSCGEAQSNENALARAWIFSLDVSHGPYPRFRSLNLLVVGPHTNLFCNSLLELQRELHPMERTLAARIMSLFTLSTGTFSITTRPTQKKYASVRLHPSPYSRGRPG